MFEFESATEFVAVAVRDAGDGMDGVVETGQASEAEDKAEAEAGAEGTAEMEAVGKAEAGIGVVLEHEFVAAAAALGLVASGYERHYKASSEAVAAWDFAASFGVVLEPRFGFVVVAASEEVHTVAPWEHTQVLLPEVQFGPIVVWLEQLDVFGTAKLDLEGWGVSVEVSKLLLFGLENEPGNIPAGTAEVALQPEDTGQASGTRF